MVDKLDKVATVVTVEEQEVYSICSETMDKVVLEDQVEMFQVIQDRLELSLF